MDKLCTPWKGFVFIDVDADLLNEKHDLGYGLTLRKATLDELSDRQVEASFRNWSERRGISDFISQRMLPPSGFPKAYRGSELDDRNQWRHAIVECSRKDILFSIVNLAFSISRADLRMGFIHLENNLFSALSWQFPMLNVRDPIGAMFLDYKLPCAGDLSELKENISYMLENLRREDFPRQILQVIQIFSSLDNLNDLSQLKALGYFAVIEGLLSHAPMAADRMDSIQKQLIRNINLLNNRLKRIGRDIRFDDFGVTKPDKVLTKFYAYRSAIAHGQEVQSSIDNIVKLRTSRENEVDLSFGLLWVHDWLRDLVKKLILAAIVEPELVTDLK